MGAAVQMDLPSRNPAQASESRAKVPTNLQGALAQQAETKVGLCSAEQRSARAERGEPSRNVPSVIQGENGGREEM